MPWPGITDFTEAVQNPGLCFGGTDLESGQVSLNPRGLPLVYSGAFACVYQVSVDDRTYAVRCFTREVSDQDARYGELSNYLLGDLLCVCPYLMAVRTVPGPASGPGGEISHR